MTELISPITDINTREIVNRALTRVSALSQGGLVSSGEHSPLRVLIEALVFVVNEEIHRINQIPEATLVALLNSLGFTASTGTVSQGTVTVTLTTIPEDPFSILTGWRLTTPDGSIFVTTEDLLIDGAVRGDVSVNSELVGEQYNVPSGAISLITPGATTSPLIASIRNSQPTTGGSDPQSQDQAITQGFNQLYAGSVLVSARDYVRRAESLVPGGRAIAVPRLSADLSSEELGVVHVFILNADHSTPSSPQLVSVQSAMEADIFIGSQVFVSPIQLVTIDVDVVAISDGSAASFQLIYKNMKNYLNPLRFSANQVYYKELEHIVRGTLGVTRVDSVALGGGQPPMVQDVPLPNAYTLPVLGEVNITLETPTGQSLQSFP